MTHHSPADYHFVFRPLTFQKPSGLSDFFVHAIGMLGYMGYMVELGGI